MELTREIAKKVLDTVDAGLVEGMGVPAPGKMCVEAAVCYALGLPHSDNPPCVGAAVRAAKIRLNDGPWSSDEARTLGMREVAIAQLGSDQCDQAVFARYVAEQTIRQIVPIALRAVAQLNPKHADALEEKAKRCESEGTREAATYAADAAYAAATYADAAADAAYADAATYAADAAYAAADSNAYATYVAADATAYAAKAAAYAAACYAGDRALNIFASILIAGLKLVGSTGCQWLDLVQ